MAHLFFAYQNKDTRCQWVWLPSKDSSPRSQCPLTQEYGHWTWVPSCLGTDLSVKTLGHDWDLVKLEVSWPKPQLNKDFKYKTPQAQSHVSWWLIFTVAFRGSPWINTLDYSCLWAAKANPLGGPVSYTRDTCSNICLATLGMSQSRFGYLED